jgi:F-type H+-transporting ATPase subunit a
MATSPHISISAETLFHVGELPITNSMLTSVIISLLIIGFAIAVRLNLKKTDHPRGLQNFAEWLVETLANFIQTITGDARKTRLFLPFFSTFFLFILLNNWFGLLPGVGTLVVSPQEEHRVEVVDKTHEEDLTLTTINEHLESDEHIQDPEHPITTDHLTATTIDSTTDAHEGEGVVAPEEAHKGNEHKPPAPIFRPGSADLNTTLALGIVSVLATQVFGLMALKLSYLKKFFNFSSPIDFFVGILEIISEFAKIISFAFRLFGNIFAGEVLLVVITFLVPVVVPMPFYGLELFVGLIQALVFAMLSLVFFNMATQSHEEH